MSSPVRLHDPVDDNIEHNERFHCASILDNRLLLASINSGKIHNQLADSWCKQMRPQKYKIQISACGVLSALCAGYGLSRLTGIYVCRSHVVRNAPMLFAAAVICLGGGMEAGADACQNMQQKKEGRVRDNVSTVTIEVKGDNWGAAQHQDIKKLLDNVASHLTRPLREDISAEIQVRSWPNDPRILYRQSGETTYQIRLNVTDTYWAQYSYQFSHEYCHLLSNYEGLKYSGSNNWFHESICEMASLFALRSMAVSWRKNPPYTNWRSCREHLLRYANNRVEDVQNEIPADDAVDSWLLEHEVVGRTNPYEREGNLIVALRMLPLFEQHPEGWNAIRHLPQSNAPIGVYLDQWQAKGHPCDWAFVGLIQKSLGTQE